MVAGGAGAGTRTTPAQQLPQSGFAYQITIPCSVDIAGETLGDQVQWYVQGLQGSEESSHGGVPVEW
jgi:hypothetical protein